MSAKKLAVGDRVIAPRAFDWQKVRAGRVFKLSPSGGLAFVEWDDKLGPQIVNASDIDHEPRPENPACLRCGGCTQKILSSDEKTLTVRCPLCGAKYETRNAGEGR